MEQEATAFADGPTATREGGEPFDPARFDRMAEEVFKPCYSLIAQQILRRTGVMRGSCADIGCGGGHLGAAIQAMTSFRMTYVDVLPESIAIARGRIARLGLSDRSAFIVSSVEKLDVDNSKFDLVVSRGSIWFWDDPLASLSFLYDSLKAGGALYVGGGFGSEELSARIRREMESRDPEWSARRHRMTKGYDSAFLRALLPRLPAGRWTIHESGAEFWIQANKPPAEAGGKLDFLGYAYCPVKQAFRDLCESTIDREWRSRDVEFAAYLPAGCEIEDPWEGVHREPEAAALPDLIASVGYGDFWGAPFARNHVARGNFSARAVDGPVNRCFRRGEIVDPESRYGIYAVSPLVLLVDPVLLGGLPAPRRLTDLCDPRYRDMVCLSSSHGDVHDDSLVQLWLDGGEDAIRSLAANVSGGLHGAEIAKRAGTDHPARSAINLITWFFARSCPRRDRLAVVWPEDGTPCTPLYYTAKDGHSERLAPLIDLLEGERLGQTFAARGFPARNPNVDNKIPNGAYLRLPGWDWLRDAAPEETRATLVSAFYEAWWAAHPGRGAMCD